MKKQFLSSLIILATTLCSFSQELNHNRISYNPTTKKLDYLIGINSNKEDVRIKLKGNKFLLLDLSMPGCKRCVKGIPRVIEFSKKYSNKLDVIMLCSYANYDIWMNIYEELHSAKLPMYILNDEKGTVAKVFETEVFPTYLLFDTNGILIRKWKGKLPKKIDKYMN
jgi:thioredoxin-related protein